MKYLIEPKNEGQYLNYSELKEFNSDKEASQYAKNMRQLLSRVLSKGDISVEYEKQIIF